jgi:hypothetical protein
VNTRTAVVVLVLVAVAMLLVIASALGADHPARPSTAIDDALGKLKSDRFLRLEGDVVAPCAQSRNVALVGVGDACAITIPKSGLLSKPTRIVLVSSSPVGLELDPDRGPALSMTLKPGKCSEAAIGRGGGTITVSQCAGLGGPCAVTLLERGCRDG